MQIKWIYTQEYKTSEEMTESQPTDSETLHVAATHPRVDLLRLLSDT